MTGLNPAAGVDFKYAPTSISTSNYTQPKVQHATNASAFTPTPGVMQEFVINSDAAKAANLLNFYAARACGPKVYTSGKFSTTTIKLSNDDGDEDVDVLTTFSPRPGFVSNEAETKPSSATVAYHQDVAWNLKYTCLGVLSVNPKNVHEQVDPAVLENAAGALGSSKTFGKYSQIVMFYTRDSMQMRSGSTSDVTTMGLTISGSGTPGSAGFAQGAIGYGDTDGALIHTDVPSLRLVVLAVNPNGRKLQSYDQFEAGLVSEIIAQQNAQQQQRLAPPSVTTGAQAVGANAAGKGGL